MSGLHINHKRNNHVLRWSLLVIALVLVGLYTYFGIRWYNTGEFSPLPLPVAAADGSIRESPITDKELENHKVASDQPRYIDIPKLDIYKSRIVKIGLTDRKMLDLPKTLDDIGWYTKSAAPGSGAGAVVLNANGTGVSREGIFTSLDSLSAGDQISLERGDGKLVTYEIVDIRSKKTEWVNKTGMIEMLYPVDKSKEGLNILISSGKWVPKDKIFDHKLLVRATLVD